MFTQVVSGGDVNGKPLRARGVDESAPMPVTHLLPYAATKAAAERLVLNFSSFFLANRHARLFLFGYILCLHLLVSCSTYLITHHTHVDCGK